MALAGDVIDWNLRSSHAERHRSIRVGSMLMNFTAKCHALSALARVIVTSLNRISVRTIIEFEISPWTSNGKILLAETGIRNAQSFAYPTFHKSFSTCSSLCQLHSLCKTIIFGRHIKMMTEFRQTTWSSLTDVTEKRKEKGEEWISYVERKVGSGQCWKALRYYK